MLELTSSFELGWVRGARFEEWGGSAFRNMAIRALLVLRNLGTPCRAHRCEFQWLRELSRSRLVDFTEKIYGGMFDFFSKNTPKTPPKICERHFQLMAS